MGYISLLDQIGTCLKPKTIPRVSGKSILKALSYFTALTEPDIMAIYALRCAFAHDFSLYNWNPRKPLLQHRFIVSQGADGPMIRLPRIPWDGNINTNDDSSKTFVNLELLGDFIEDIIRKLKIQSTQDNLEIALPNGGIGFLTRYMNVSLSI